MRDEKTGVRKLQLDSDEDADKIENIMNEEVCMKSFLFTLALVLELFYIHTICFSCKKLNNNKKVLDTLS